MSFDKQHVMGAAAEASEPALVSDQAPAGLDPTGFDQAHGLLPCPKCGAIPYLDQMNTPSECERYGYRYERVCGDCSWAFGTAETTDEATALWNTRAALKASSRQEERLREALDRQCDTMAFILNHAELSEQWFEKFSRELIEDRAALEPPHAKDPADV